MTFDLKIVFWVLMFLIVTKSFWMKATHVRWLITEEEENFFSPGERREFCRSFGRFGCYFEAEYNILWGLER